MYMIWQYLSFSLSSGYAGELGNDLTLTPSDPHLTWACAGIGLRIGFDSTSLAMINLCSLDTFILIYTKQQPTLLGDSEFIHRKGQIKRW